MQVGLLFFAALQVAIYGQAAHKTAPALFASFATLTL